MINDLKVSIFFSIMCLCIQALPIKYSMNIGYSQSCQRSAFGLIQLQKLGVSALALLYLPLYTLDWRFWSADDDDDGCEQTKTKD